MKSITIDYGKRLAEEPDKGHNRWHEAIPPVIEAAPGEEVEIQTRDAFDGQITPSTTRRGSAPLRPQPRPSADRPGLCRRGRAGRPARGRDLRHEAGRLRLHRGSAGVRLSARRLSRALHRQMDDQGRLCRIRRSARCAHSRRLLCRRHRRRSIERIARDDPAPRGEPAGPRRHGAAARKSTARCRLPSRSPRRRCARSRRARTAAISTSSS